MTEIQIGEAKIKGGRLLLLIPLLGTLGGGAYAAFEFWADYQALKEIVEEVDVQAITAANELVLTKLDAAVDLSRDIRNNLREDILKLEGYIDKIDNKVEASSDRIKDTQASIDGVLENIFSEMNQVQKDVTASIREIEALNRDTEKDVRDSLRETIDRIDADMTKLEDDLNERLQEAFDNPLAN